LTALIGVMNLNQGSEIMVRNFFYATAMMMAVWSVSAASVSAQFGEGNSPNNLFPQYYTQPGASLTTAAMYPAPHWVPSHVGHTYYTYQPLMPHEMLYQHSRNYYNYYNTGGYYGSPNALNRTQVRWQSGTNHMGPLPMSGNVLQAAKWRFHSQRYCLDGDGSGGVGSGHARGLIHGVGSRLHGSHGHGHGVQGDCQGYAGGHGHGDAHASGCQCQGCLSQQNNANLQR
jgi:hypothetical protein